MSKPPGIRAFGCRWPLFPEDWHGTPDNTRTNEQNRPSENTQRDERSTTISIFSRAKCVQRSARFSTEVGGV